MQSPKKVLIAEDNGEFLKNAVSSFRTYGFECVSVPRDGAQVLKALEASSPDIFVTEAFLSHFDALAVLKMMPTLKLKKRPITVVLSGCVKVGFVQQLRASR